MGSYRQPQIIFCKADTSTRWVIRWGNASCTLAVAKKLMESSPVCRMSSEQRGMFLRG